VISFLTELHTRFRKPWEMDYGAYDIENMFVKIPHGDTRRAFSAMRKHFGEIFILIDREYRVYGHTTRRPDPTVTRFLSMEDLSEILDLELRISAFVFGSVVVRQLLGHGMGKQSSPSLASLTVFFMKFEATMQSPMTLSLSTSFMDDTFEAYYEDSWMKTVYQPLLENSGMSLKHEGWKENQRIQFMQFNIKCDSAFPDYTYKPRDKLRFVRWSTVYGERYFTNLVLSTCCAIDMYSSNFENFRTSLSDYMHIWAQRQWPKKLVKAGLLWFLTKRHAQRLRSWLPILLKMWKTASERFH
jgi:hypothetical protein